MTIATAGHQLGGHFNPRCLRCGQLLMWILAHPAVACDQVQAAFTEKPVAAKAAGPALQTKAQ